MIIDYEFIINLIKLCKSDNEDTENKNNICDQFDSIIRRTFGLRKNQVSDLDFAIKARVEWLKNCLEKCEES